MAVPFGRSPRATGYVVGLPTVPPPGFELKDVAGVLDEFPPFTPPLLRLIRWAEDYYLAPPGELMRAALPPGLNARKGASAPTRRGVEFAAPSPGAADALATMGARAHARRAVLEYLLARGRIPVEELRTAFPRGRPALTALVKAGLATIETVAVAAGGGALLPAAGTPFPLTDDQAAALAASPGPPAPSRPSSSTGSPARARPRSTCTPSPLRARRGQGRARARARDRAHPAAGRRASAARFGDQVALLHCGLSDAERHGEWLRLRRGEAPHLRGGAQRRLRPGRRTSASWWSTRSTTRPSSRTTGPRYHARDLAVVRAREEGAVCVLGSATPSLETLENARTGKYERLELPRRIDDRPLPEVRIVDLSRIRKGAPLPRPALAGPRRGDPGHGPAGRQVILFLNRRGFETLVLCRDCGRGGALPELLGLAHPARAARRAPLPLLRHDPAHEPALSRCGGERAGAGGRHRAGRGGGPRARPGGAGGPLDRDAVTGAADVAELLARFARRELDVLVGTQMVTKGHDFPGVTLVGVVLADTALALPDFRAAERTFQLLTQVAGRAGRGDDAGQVIVQTFHPHSPAVAFSVGHDYAGFAEVELDRRRALGYPPFGRMMAVRVEGSEAGARRTAEALGEAARPALTAGVTMLGPAPAAIERIRGKSRWHLLFRASEPAALRRVHRALGPAALRPPGGASVRFDVDPHAML